MEGRWTKHPRKLNNYTFTLLNAANGSHAGLKNAFMVSDLQIKVRTTQWFFTLTAVKSMLEGKYHSGNDMVSPLIKAFID